VHINNFPNRCIHTRAHHVPWLARSIIFGHSSVHLALPRVTFSISLSPLPPSLPRRMKERDAQRKEKWAADRAEEVGEAGTVSAACKVMEGGSYVSYIIY